MVWKSIVQTNDVLCMPRPADPAPRRRHPGTQKNWCIPVLTTNQRFSNLASGKRHSHSATFPRANATLGKQNEKEKEKEKYVWIFWSWYIQGKDVRNSKTWCKAILPKLGVRRTEYHGHDGKIETSWLIIFCENKEKVSSSKSLGGVYRIPRITQELKLFFSFPI